MVVLVPAVVAGLLTGLVVWLAAKKWPTAPVAAPAVSPRLLVREVSRHQRLRRFLRARVEPTVATGLALSAAVVTVVASVAAAGVLLYMVRANTGLARFDRGAATWAAARATPTSTGVLRVVTRFGGANVLVVAAIVIVAVEHQRLPERATALFLALDLGGVSLVVNVVKWLVDRARPAFDQLTGYSSSSFPSGHAASAAALFAGFALLIGRSRSLRVRAALAGASAGGAVTVAASRVLLGVHWLTDVTAGLIVGWGWFALCSIAFGGRLLRFGSPVEQAETIAALLDPSTGR